MTVLRARPAQYLLLVFVPAVVVAGLLHLGPDPLPMIVVDPLGTDATSAQRLPSAAPVPSAFRLDLLVLQLAVVLMAARGCGWLARRVGQPAVIGEMFAGIALGPSILGALTPSLSATLFPTVSLPFLNALSQLGVLLFLFVVGLHVDLPALRRQSGTAVLASHASIAAPFTLGVALAHLLFVRFAPAGVPFSAFALFLGVAMSVTAFPVLARILEERRLLGTPMGSLAVACAAVDDVTAWVLLTVVVAIVHSAGFVAPLAATFGGTIAFVAFMYAVLRPLLARWNARPARAERQPAAALSVLIIVALLAAITTESIGIHALFGAFVAGTIVPREDGLAERTGRQLGDLLAVLLLPLFFAYTGLRTDLRSVATPSDLAVLGAILAVAIFGKVGGTALAARSGGQSWHDAAILGVLMNTRGLMELVVLNIGLDLGVLSPPLFGLMVIMALVTTAMTVPSLTALGWWQRRAHKG